MEKNRKTLKFNKKTLFLNVEHYIFNEGLAVTANTKNDFYGDITVNLGGYSLDKNEAFISSITKDCGLEKKLIEEGIIKKVVCTVNYNMGKYDRVVFDIEKLKEYDPKGVKDYQSLEDEEEFE